MIFAGLIFALLLVMISANEIHERLRPRQTAPSFKAKAVLNDQFIDVSLAETIADGKWSVLLFYPFDYTFVCPVSTFLFLYLWGFFAYHV